MKGLTAFPWDSSSRYGKNVAQQVARFKNGWQEIVPGRQYTIYDMVGRLNTVSGYSEGGVDGSVSGVA